MSRSWITAWRFRGSRVVALAGLLAAAMGVSCSDDGASPAPAGTSGSNTGGTDPGTGGGTSTTGGDGSGGQLVTIDAGTGASGGVDVGGCVGEGAETQANPVDLFILLDQSGSMVLEGDRWDPVSSSLAAFVNDPSLSGVGVGLQYFPLGAATPEDPAICNVDNYVTPAVPFGELPDHAQTIVDSIDAHYFSTEEEARAAEHWGTPTLPATQGALQYLATWAGAHPDHMVVLLLATDGQPMKRFFSGVEICPDNDTAHIAQELEAAATGPHNITTYVIGIGDNVDRLETLADAGHTGHGPFLVSDANTQDEFVAALNEIRDLTLPCDYPIPAPPHR